MLEIQRTGESVGSINISNRVNRMYTEQDIYYDFITTKLITLIPYATLLQSAVCRPIEHLDPPSKLSKTI